VDNASRTSQTSEH